MTPSVRVIITAFRLPAPPHPESLAENAFSFSSSSNGLEMIHLSSWPGLTRPSIVSFEGMDARVKPAHDELFISLHPAMTDGRVRFAGCLVGII